MKKLRQTDWGVITSSLLNTLSYTVLFYSSIRRSRLAADLTFQVRWLTQSWCCLEIFVYATEFPTNIQAENTSGHHLMNNLTGHFTSPHLNDALGRFGPLSSLSLSKTQRLSNFQGWMWWTDLCQCEAFSNFKQLLLTQEIHRNPAPRSM